MLDTLHVHTVKNFPEIDEEHVKRWSKFEVYINPKGVNAPLCRLSLEVFQDDEAAAVEIPQ